MQTTTQDGFLMAEARGCAYAVVAAGFRYPTAVPLVELGDPELWERIDRLRNRHPEWSGQVSRLQVVVEELQADVRAFNRILETLESVYSVLFGHAVRGSCPPYELEYGPGEIVQRAPDLADIAGFYSAFGMEMAADSDRPDHVTAECEFMSWLCFKEADALRNESREFVDQSRHAQRSFLRDHLARWLPAFAHRIAERRDRGFYAALSHFASTFMDMECAHFGLPAGPENLALRPVDPDRDATIECGPENSCVPGTRQLVQVNVGSG